MYDSRSQRLDTNFLNLKNTIHHIFWSTRIQMAPDNLQKHTRDQSLSHGHPWLFQSTWRKRGIQFCPPNSTTSRYSAATQNPLSQLLNNNDPNRPTNLHICSYDWRLGCGTTLMFLGVLRGCVLYESRPQIIVLKLLHRSSIHDHKNWSTAMQIAQKTCKYIPMIDE